MRVPILPMCVLLLAGGCARAREPNTAPPSPTLFRVHIDQVKPGRRATLEAVRAEYLGWVRAYATPPGESPVVFVALEPLGEGAPTELWALRSAASWGEIPEQAQRDDAAVERVRAAVGSKLDDNDARMHGNIVSHRNEILRLQRGLSHWDERRGWRDVYAELRFVVVDDVQPAESDAYAAELSRGSPEHGAWRIALFSSPGSGHHVHLVGGPGAQATLPGSNHVVSRRVYAASHLASLSSP